MPQGSDLAPIVFVLYTVNLLTVTKGYGLCPHMYANDMQVYGYCRMTQMTPSH